MSEQSTCPAGYSRIAQKKGSDGDLNQKCGGKYIYLCKRTGGGYGEALKEVLLQNYPGGGGSCPSGYSRVKHAKTLNGDLNQGTRGEWLYLCYKK